MAATQTEMLSLAKKLSMDIPENEISDYGEFLKRMEQTLEAVAAMEGKNNHKALHRDIVG